MTMDTDIAELTFDRDASRKTVLPGTNGSDREKEQSGGHPRYTYQPGAILYQEGEKCEGIFHLTSGRVKLSVSSSNGRAAIMKFAQAGELLGVTEALLNRSYLATAEVIQSAEIRFISSNHLDRILSKRELAVQVVAQLARESSRMFKEVRAYRLSFTASQRLAQLLLELLRHATGVGHKGVLEMPYTHVEISQLIGCSRETVTRLLKRFQEMRLIDIDRSRIYPGQIDKLREIAQL